MSPLAPDSSRRARGRLHLVLACLSASISLIAYSQTPKDPCAQYFTHDPAEPFNEARVVDHDGFLQAESFRTNLLLMRDNPELIPRYSEALAKRLLNTEAILRKQANSVTQYPPADPAFNLTHPAFTFEYSAMLKDQPALAAGPALDVYLREDSDWSFLPQTPGWNRSAPDAWVGMFLFPRSVEMGRDPTYAAREAAPILEKQLQLAARRESSKLWYPLILSPLDYSYNLTTRQLTIKTDLLQPASVQPASIPSTRISSSLAFYQLPDAGSGAAEDNVHIPGGFRTLSPELTTWRKMVEFSAGAKTVALDRQLHLPQLALSPAAADTARLEHPETILHLRLFLDVQHAIPNAGSTTEFVLLAQVEKIDLVDERGHVIASVTGRSLPAVSGVPGLAPHAMFGESFEEGNKRTKGLNCRNIQASVEQSQRETAAKIRVQEAANKAAETRNQACNEQSAHQADTAGPSPGPVWQAAFKVAREACLVNGPSQTAAGGIPPPVQPLAPSYASGSTPIAARHTSREASVVQPAEITPRPPIPIPHNYALIFSAGTYDHWPSLSNPIPDGDAIGEALKSLYSSQVEQIRNPTLEQIEGKLREYTHRVFKPEDQLVIYFAGHGYFDDDQNRGYLVPRDAPLLSEDASHRGLIQHDVILGFVERVPSRHIVLIIDACFAGTLDRRVRDAGLRGDFYAPASLPERLLREESKRTRRYFTSGGKDFVPDGFPGHHSPFAAALLNTLEGAATENGYLTLNDLQQGLARVAGPEPRSGEMEGNDASADFILLTPRAANLINAAK